MLSIVGLLFILIRRKKTAEGGYSRKGISTMLGSAGCTLAHQPA